MNKKDLIVAVATILTTALEIGDDPFPESMAYLALGGDISKWGCVKGFLLHGELVTIKYNSISLTPKGRTLAEEIERKLKVA